MKYHKKGQPSKMPKTMCFAEGGYVGSVSDAPIKTSGGERVNREAKGDKDTSKSPARYGGNNADLPIAKKGTNARAAWDDRWKDYHSGKE